MHESAAPSNRPHQRGGLTFVDVLVAGLLMALSFAYALRLQNEELQETRMQATSAIFLTISSQARSLSKELGNSTGLRFGTRISSDELGTRISLVQANGTTITEVTDDQGTMACHYLAKDECFWLADMPLDSEKSLTWFYDPQTGRTQMLSNDTWQNIAVGTAVADEHTPVEGYNIDTGTNLAPASNDVPGLSLRSTDNRVAYALGVRRSGDAFRHPFNTD